MTKSMIIGLILAGVVAIGGVFFVMNNSDDKSSNDSAVTSGSSNSDNATAETTLVDPEGVYALFSDPSVTKHPENGFVFGAGQEMSFDYDGSKTANDPYATLTYELYYIQDNGTVVPMTNGNLSGSGSGTFSTTDSVFRSEVDGKKGFVGLVATYDTGADDSGAISGTNVKLGMYSVTYEVSE